MKKNNRYIKILASILLFSLSACSTANNGNRNNENTKTDSKITEENSVNVNSNNVNNLSNENEKDLINMVYDKLPYSYQQHVRKDKVTVSEYTHDSDFFVIDIDTSDIVNIKGIETFCVTFPIEPSDQVVVYVEKNSKKILGIQPKE